MQIRNRWLLALICTVILPYMVGCTSRGNQGVAVVQIGTTKITSPTNFTIAPSSLPVPEGVEADVWKLLTVELERQLIDLQGATRVENGLLLRTASSPPLTQRSRTTLNNTTSGFSWRYHSNGDYDQNSEVNLADLAPLAIHFQESALPFKFPTNSIQAVIDGDDNGEINLADVTPIALNFQNNVAQFNVYGSKKILDYPTTPDGNNGSAELLASIAVGEATGDLGKERLQFTSSLPGPLVGEYLWLRPTDSDNNEGIASTRIGPVYSTYIIDGFVYMAGDETDPLPGATVELTGDVTASTVTDEIGFYSFEVPVGEYTVTPTEDPYIYLPGNIDTPITDADQHLPPFYTTFAITGHIYMAGGGTDGLLGAPVDLTGDATSSTVTDENGLYSFNGLLRGEYTVTPSGDPYGYTPGSLPATIHSESQHLSPIYPTPVDIVHHWVLDDSMDEMDWLFGDLQIDADNNVFITSGVASSNNQDYRNCLLKYDMFGELVWSKVFDLPFGSSGSRIFLLPNGEIYLAGVYAIFEGTFYNFTDLYVMKLDSSGNLLWKYAFNYPNSALEEHREISLQGYVDPQNNLHVSAQQHQPPNFNSFMLEISPDGVQRSLVHIEPNLPAFENVVIESFALDSLGGLLVGGFFAGDWVQNEEFLLRINPGGEIDWQRNWGEQGSSSKAAKLEAGLDGFIYHTFAGYLQNQAGVVGIQLASFTSSGNRNWGIECITPFGNRGGPYLAIGPQGKLWISGDESVPNPLGPNPFDVNTFIWSFMPESDLRFSRQWRTADLEPGLNQYTEVNGLEVNSFGVAILTGMTDSISREWVEHEVTITDTNWTLRQDGLTIYPDDPGELLELPAVEIPDNGMVDPPIEDNPETFIMLYRP